jgi:hypothetical protein
MPHLCSAAIALILFVPPAQISAQAITDPASIIQAQEKQSVETAEQWLASKEPRIRAWGAYLALRDQRRELLPRLFELAQSSASQQAADRRAMLSILDAIIQMNGQMSVEEAEKLYPSYPVQSLIFLSKAQGSNAADALLRVFQGESRYSAAWLAAGNLLIAMQPKPAGFASAVLKDFTVAATITVLNPGDKPKPTGTAGSCLGGVPSSVSGWPSVGNYYPATNYSTYGQPRILLAAGTDPAYYVRIVGPPDEFVSWGESECYFRPNRSLIREHFLAGLAGESPSDPSVRSRLETTITWHDDSQYLRDLRAFVDKQQSLYDAVAQRLVNSGWLTAAERSVVRPKLSISILDDRAAKLSSLPTFEQAGVEVKSVR